MSGDLDSGTASFCSWRRRGPGCAGNAERDARPAPAEAISRSRRLAVADLPIDGLYKMASEDDETRDGHAPPQHG